MGVAPMKKEVPASTNPGPDDWDPWRHHDHARHHRPANQYEALMSCAPGDEPELSIAELAELREILEDAIQQHLTDEEQWVFNQIVVGQTSLRKMGIPRTTAARIRDTAIRKLQAALADMPAVVAYLERNNPERDE